MSVLASEMLEKVGSARAALQEVEGHLSPMLKLSSADVLRNLAPLEKAELQVALAYSAVSIYYCNLLAQGVDAKDHPITQDIDRIKLYFAKIRNTVTDIVAEEEADRLRIDVDAAERMIRHHLAAAEASSQRQAAAAARQAAELQSSVAQDDGTSGMPAAEAEGMGHAEVGSEAASPGKKRRRGATKGNADGAAASPAKKKRKKAQGGVQKANQGDD